MRVETSPSSYLALLRSPGVLSPFCAAALIRFSYACLVLSLLLTVEAATDSYAVAGAALAASGLGTLSAPYKARLIDRLGLRSVLTTLGLGFALTLCCITIAAVAGVSSPAVFIAAATLAGLLTPPVGPIMRGIWAELAPDVQTRTRAYSLDAVAEEGLFAVGPLAVGVVIALSEPRLSLLVVAGAAAVGTVWLVLSQATLGSELSAKSKGRRSSAVLGPLSAPGVRWVAAVMVCVGIGLAPLEVAVAARAEDFGTIEAAGPLLAALSVGSIVGGFAWGARRHRHTPPVQLLGLVAAMGVGAAIAGLAPNLVALGAALALAGAFVAPVFVVAYSMVDDLVEADVRTEASTWIASASNIGGSAGAVSAGIIVERASAQAAFLAGGLLLMAAVFLLAGRARGQRSTAAP